MSSDDANVIEIPESLFSREVFRITSVDEDGRVEGERWDEDQQRYRQTKPFVLHEGIQEISIEYADEDAG